MSRHECPPSCAALTGEQWLKKHDPAYRRTAPDDDPLANPSDPLTRVHAFRERKRYQNVLVVGGLAVDPTRKYCRGALHKADCQHLDQRHHGQLTKSVTSRGEGHSRRRRRAMTADEQAAMDRWIRDEWNPNFYYSKLLADDGLARIRALDEEMGYRRQTD